MLISGRELSGPAHLLTYPAVLDGLDLLIRARPPRLRLVLAARSDPLLPMYRYRLAGLMRELCTTELAMRRGEVRELLLTHGVTLLPEDLDKLLARTEGWVAGLRLSAMRMEGTENPARFVSELALGQGSIGEYLMAEVLDRRPVPAPVSKPAHHRRARRTAIRARGPGPRHVSRFPGC